MRPSHLCSVPENSCAQAIPIGDAASYAEVMAPGLSIEPSITNAPTLSDHLNRKKLDVNVDGLRERDRYLVYLPDRERELLRPRSLTTVWTIAVYRGEVARRAAPEKKYQWVTVGEDAMPAGHTTYAHASIGASRGLCAADGDVSMSRRGSYVSRAAGSHA